MAVRFRRSVKSAPGVRMNVGKRGLGLSVGTRVAHYSVSASGRHTASAGIPGTGLGYTSSSGGGRSRGRSLARPAARAMPAPSVPKPGMLAPTYEKRFAKLLSA